jgi:hypothetical protein
MAQEIGIVIGFFILSFGINSWWNENNKFAYWKVLVLIGLTLEAWIFWFIEHEVSLFARTIAIFGFGMLVWWMSVMNFARKGISGFLKKINFKWLFDETVESGKDMFFLMGFILVIFLVMGGISIIISLVQTPSPPDYP